MEYKKDYFGFVYEWHDAKRDMKYIGSHHGSVNSGYVCSNTQMLRAYKKRPHDFTRAILAYSTVDNHQHTKQLEQFYLDQVSNIKDNPMYYNKKNEAEGGWSFISSEHVEKRATTLKEKHKHVGLSAAEKNSYQKKIATRLARIAESGFTKKEQQQHSSYGCKCKVIFPDGTEQVYNSMGQASRATGIDCQYGRSVTLQGRTYKGYQVIILEEPTVDCRTFKK